MPQAPARQRRTLSVVERSIEANKTELGKLGQAFYADFAEIDEAQLWRENDAYKSFGDYCSARWGISRATLGRWRLMAAELSVAPKPKAIGTGKAKVKEAPAPTPPASQRQAIAARAERNTRTRSSDPGPAPTPITSAHSRNIPTAAPAPERPATASGITQADVAHLVDHLGDLDAHEVGRVATGSQRAVIRNWIRRWTGAGGVITDPPGKASDCKHPANRRIGDTCAACNATVKR